MLIKIYLKNVKKPFEIEFESKTSLDKFYNDLQTKSIIKVGPLSFNINDFSYCIES